jgi:PKD repeat protein
MKVLSNSILLLLLIASLSCKKKEYPQSAILTDKVFYFNASIDGVPLSIAAGANNYYMYSSYKLDSNNVYGFIANLKQLDCNSNCANSLEIKINDFKVSVGNTPVLIDQALYPFTYSMVAGSSYDVKFQAMYNKTAASYLWDFGDGFTSAAASPIHTFERNGKYNVSLKINGTNSCVGSISNFQKIGSPGNSITTISDSSLNSNDIQFFSNTQGAFAQSYLWNFGDGSVSALANPVHNYSITGSYPVTLRVITASDTTFTEYNTVTQSDQSSCVTNYSISSVTPVKALALSGITVKWTDASGITYTSDNSLQPLSSYFKIISVETYDNNENNETTKKIRVQFKCKVYNGTNSKSIDNAETVICVSYK